MGIRLQTTRWLRGMAPRAHERARCSARGLAVACALALGASACGDDGPSGSPEPIRIGIVLDLSGEVSEFTQALLNSAELVIQELNAAGGIADGRELQLVPGNTTGLREGAVTAAERLIDEEGVLGLTGFDSSGEALPVVPVAAEHEVSMVSCCATSDALSAAEPPVERFFFRTVPPDSLQAPILADAAFERGCTRLGSYHTDDAYGVPLAESLEAAFEARGGTGVFRLAIDADAPSFRGVVRDGAAEDPDCVALIAFPTELGILRRDWQEEGAPEVQWFASDGAFSDNFADRTVTDATLWEGLVVSAPELSPTSPRQRTYVESYRVAYGEAPGPFGAQQYDATAVLVLAIAHALREGPGEMEAIRDGLYEVTRPGEGKAVVVPGDLRDALAALDDGLGLDYQGATGAVDFDDCGNVVGDYALYEFQVDSESFELLERVTVDEGAPCPPP